jgi:Na+-transporting methylmalonyl-CoA/oxaloacetate decarboxylase gamma subunit
MMTDLWLAVMGIALTVSFLTKLAYVIYIIHSIRSRKHVEQNKLERTG